MERLLAPAEMAAKCSEIMTGAEAARRAGTLLAAEDAAARVSRMIRVPAGPEDETKGDTP